MRVYLSGKIGRSAEISKATLEKFASRERFLLEQGCEVFNPTTSGLGAQAEKLASENGTDFYTEILLLDLAELRKCDAIYLLHDWEESPGSCAEVTYAVAIGKSVMSETRGGDLGLWGKA